ncbi:MAG: DUF6431 domain-containing protein [Lachnoclostridium sp.]|jgi:transposase-like protein|nr:DUF6431 domain-containing protein [Lachnoclostridium sp.]
MIKEKTIFGKLNQCHLSDWQLWKAFTPSVKTCRICGAEDCCQPHDSYLRSMIYIHNHSRQEDVISIQRVKCSSCGKTHAILPDLLIPFGSFTLRFVIYVLKAYLSRTGSVAELCDFFSIAVSTLYDWIHRFREQANLLLSALEQIEWVSQEAIHRIESFPSLPTTFFLDFRFSFLQHRKTAT